MVYVQHMVSWRAIAILTFFTSAILWPFIHVARADDDLAALGDEFDSPATLDSWGRAFEEWGWPDQIAVVDIDETSPGHLYIEPEVSGWFDDYRGVFLHREVTGDFDVTVRVMATGRSGAIPTRSFSLAGIMVRAPRDDLGAAAWSPGLESWLFLNTGSADQPGIAQLEWKTTIDSRSVLTIGPSRTGWVELRIERRGSEFRLLRRFEGEDWAEVVTYSRPDLPETILVGPDAYTDWSNVSGAGSAAAFNPLLIESPPGQRDLVARWDWIRFSRPCPSDPVDGCDDPVPFLRGDPNGDTVRDVSDAVRILLALFVDGSALPCEKSADTNDDGAVVLADAVSLLQYIFLDGAPPAEPLSACGVDETADALSCESFPGCEGL